MNGFGGFSQKGNEMTMSGEFDPEHNLYNALNNLNVRKINRRAQVNVKILEPMDDGDDEGPELFTAQPSDEIPRNKLTEKLARGLQFFV